MAEDEKKDDESPKVRAYDRQGNKVMVPKDQVGQLYGMGGRVANAQERQEHDLDEQYSKASTTEKALGHAGVALGPVASSTLTGLGASAVDPRVAAYERDVKNTVTLGADEVGIKRAMDPAAGKAYGERVTAPGQAHEDYATAGSIVGMTALALGGSGLGGARALATPGSAVMGLGGFAEGLTGRALGGLAARGVLGRAASTGAKLAVRGAVEGGITNVAHQAVQDDLTDTPQTGAKLYAALGHGMLGGAVIGGGLGVSGSLASSGVKGLARAARGALPKGMSIEVGGAPKGMALEAIDADAGLRGGIEPIEKPFQLGAERRPVQLRPDVGQRTAVAAEDAIRFPKDKPLTLENLFTAEGERSPLSINQDAGIAPLKRGSGGRIEVQGPVEATDALRLSSAKTVPRAVDLVAEEATAIHAAEPIKIPTKKLGVTDLLTQPNDAARALAADQAWNAAGAGFGLQSTRYAKQAAAYLPNGTRDVGEAAIRFGVVDVPQNASPLDAAMHAARTGTPGEMLPRAVAAHDSVGAQLGEMTERSGGRVRNAAIVDAIDSVAKEYEKTAATRSVGRNVRAFGLDLLDSLGIQGRDGTVRLQDVLRERKGMDRLVFQDAPTLDPKMALQAKRELRGRVEDAIMDALDESSGKISGAEKARYKALKKDFVSLSILTEALEDSAARVEKSGGLGMKDLLFGALSGGGVGSGAMLALGSKLARERGNAAAAAYLSRAADRGTFAKLVRSVNENVEGNAKNLFREASTEGSASGSKAAKEPTPAKVTRGRDEQAEVVSNAQKLVKWSSDLRANPQRALDQLKDAADLIGRTAGANASSAYTASAIKAMNYLVSYIPVRERRDPLDPRSVPPMTYEEAERAVRAAKYATKPLSVFADFGRGIVTPEGIRAAETFMPDEMALFRQELFRHATDHMLRNRQLTASRRLQLDKLGIPAIRPDSVVALQANLMKAPDEGAPPAKPSPGKPTGMKVQQSGFDAIEARLTG